MERRIRTFVGLGHRPHHLFLLLCATVALEREYGMPYGKRLSPSLPALALAVSPWPPMLRALPSSRAHHAPA